MSKESTPSEKAADRMHADLSAMLADAQRHRRACATGSEPETAWFLVANNIQNAIDKLHYCMSERDARIAQNG